LATARRPDHRNEFVGLDAQIDGVESADGFVDLGEPFDLKRGHRAVPHSSASPKRAFSAAVPDLLGLLPFITRRVRPARWGDSARAMAPAALMPLLLRSSVRNPARCAAPASAAAPPLPRKLPPRSSSSSLCRVGERAMASAPLAVISFDHNFRQVKPDSAAEF